MSKFPLYDILNKNIPKKDLTIKQKKELSSNIELYTDIQEIVYVLIRYYQYYNENLEKLAIPYGGTYIKKNENKITDTNVPDEKNINFDLELFPIPLKHIIYNFILMHKKNLETNTPTDNYIDTKISI